MSSTVANILERANAAGGDVLLSEWADPRVVDAVAAAAIALPNVRVRLVAPRDEAETLRAQLGQNAVVAIEPGATLNDLAARLVEKRKHKGMTPEKALVAVQDPLLFASLAVDAGLAAGTVNGAVRTTADVIRAYIQSFGTAPGIKTVSSFFLMILNPGTDQEKPVVYADCGLVIDPSAQQQAEIAVASANSLNALTGLDPKVAFLSFSTKGSAAHPRVEKVTEALTIARNLAPNVSMDGELQFDAAFLPTIGKRKAPDSDVAGQANVFIFPDLDSGNIAYKITERVGGAIALGPIVQGLAKPANDLSRGCSTDDIVKTIAITALQA